MKIEKNIPWEVKWANTMTKVEDLLNKVEFQSDLVKEQVEIKH